MEEQKRSLERRIFRAGMFILIAHSLFKLAGLIQAMVMGRCLPQSTFDVVYVFAFENCIYMLFLIGEGILSPSFLPVFMREAEVESERSAWRFASTVLTVQFMLLVVVAAAFCMFPHVVVDLLTRWGQDETPERYLLAVNSVRRLAPAVIGLSLGSTTYALLNGYKRFFLAAFGDAVWKFCVVLFLLASLAFSHNSKQMLIWGLVAGAFCKVGTHLLGLRGKLHYIRPSLDFSHPAFRSLLLLSLPLIAGILVARVRDAVNNVYILSTLEESGLMQANSMGRKLQSTISYVIPFTLSIAVFPFFCELSSRNDHDNLDRLVTRFGRMLLSLFIPVSIFVAVAAIPFTSLIFRGGYFDTLAVQRTAVSLTFYTFVLPAAAIEMLVMRVFFAHRRMYAVTIIGMVFSSLSVLISWIGLRVSDGRDLVILGFIAGGFTLTRVLKCVTLVEVLRKNSKVFPFLQTALFLARVMLATLPAAAGAWLLLRQIGDLGILDGRLKEIVKLGASGALFSLIYLGCAYALRIGEVHELFDLLREKLRKRA